MWRERRALRAFQRKLASHSPADDPERLNNLKTALSLVPDSSFIQELKSLVGAVTGGGDFDGASVVQHVEGSISTADEVLRFSINGLVIVGLMGTLFAFYQMWRSRGAANITALDSNVYLHSMSTALVVSFMGLGLALITSLVFSILKARRQVLLNSMAATLTPIAALFPIESKTNVLLRNLLTPLTGLVEQITLQNEKVLGTLIEAVNNRTEQLNTLITQATKSWQLASETFRTETVSAVGNLQAAAGNLADSSQQVATTMVEVSRGLERTKDIGKIVDQLDSTSQSVVQNISGKLGEATQTWTTAISSATEEYKKANERQTEAMRREREQLRRDVVADFSAVIKQSTATLKRLETDAAQLDENLRANMLSHLTGLQAEYLKTLDGIAGTWMTEWKSGFGQVTTSMEGILAEWKTTLTDVSSTIQTSLVGARESMTETARQVRSVDENLVTLQNFTTMMADQVGAPVNLTVAVQELVKTNEFLQALASDLQRREVFMQMNDALAANSGELRGLTQRLDGLDAIGNGNKDLAQALRDMHEALSSTAARIDLFEESVRSQL